MRLMKRKGKPTLLGGWGAGCGGFAGVGVWFSVGWLANCSLGFVGWLALGWWERKRKPSSLGFGVGGSGGLGVGCSLWFACILAC